VSAVTLLRLLLVPAAVWLASLAARRFGHRVSGYLGGMPLIGGPITLFLALDHGADFAARSATLTLGAIAGQAAQLLVFTHAARVARWPMALIAGWSAFLAAALGVAWLEPRPVAALALAMASLALARLLLPHESGAPSRPSIPPLEMRMRLGAAFLLAALILWSAARFGPVVSGLLLSLPITGSIMPPFTLSLYGSDAVARLVRGFLTGLTGFMSFFFVVASCTVPWGIPAAFAAGILAALAAVALAVRLQAASRNP
jgi:hypothetical protein